MLREPQVTYEVRDDWVLHLCLFFNIPVLEDIAVLYHARDAHFLIDYLHVSVLDVLVGESWPLKHLATDVRLVFGRHDHFL